MLAMQGDWRKGETETGLVRQRSEWRGQVLQTICLMVPAKDSILRRPMSIIVIIHHWVLPMLLIGTGKGRSVNKGRSISRSLCAHLVRRRQRILGLDVYLPRCGSIHSGTLFAGNNRSHGDLERVKGRRMPWFSYLTFPCRGIWYMVNGYMLSWESMIMIIYSRLPT